MGDDLVFNSAAVIPMTSSEWQAVLNSDSAEVEPEDAKFRWDGEFTPNQQLLGDWKAIAQVAEIAEFDPEAKPNRGRPIFSAMTFEDGGKTGDATWVWSGDVLMDLTKFQALRMEVRTIAARSFCSLKTEDSASGTSRSGRRFGTYLPSNLANRRTLNSPPGTDWQPEDTTNTSSDLHTQLSSIY